MIESSMFEEMLCLEWIRLAQNMIKWRAILYDVMQPCLPI